MQKTDNGVLGFLKNPLVTLPWKSSTAIFLGGLQRPLVPSSVSPLLCLLFALSHPQIPLHS